MTALLGSAAVVVVQLLLDGAIITNRLAGF